MNVKSCNNCGFEVCRKSVLRQPDTSVEPCEFWRKIPCPYCGGALSEIREDGQRRWRYCYACHFEFEDGKDESKA